MDGGTYNLRFRHSVLIFDEGEAEDWSVKFTGATESFQSYIQGKKKAANVKNDKDVQLEGDEGRFAEFVSCFDV